MPQELRVASPPSKPLLVYDGDCHFCRRWIARWQNATGDAVTYLPYQTESMAGRFPEIPRRDFEQSVHLILPDGSVCSGAEAVFRSLEEAGKERWLIHLYRDFPGFADLAELLYEEVAAHRSFFSKLDKIYSGPSFVPLSYVRVRFIFLRGLALIYLIAFASLFGQIQGLAGSRGIVPAATVMEMLKAEAVDQHIGLERFHAVPTLAWWSASDSALNWQCGAGVTLSLLLFFGIAPAPALFLLWCLYLSLTTICGPFLSFQWDTLLLETGFLAIFYAPLQWLERPSRQSAPSTTVLWLLRWLIFRLMLESGCVKLMSGDISWWNLTALRVHYETQPLPTWIGWYAHQMPAGVQAFCTFVLLFIELAVPALIFAGHRARLTAAGIFALLQVLIMLTGNYTFFNWLTILLCVPLLDDDALKPRRPISAVLAMPSSASRCRRWPRFILLPIAFVIGLVTLMGLLGTLRVAERWPAPALALHDWLEPFRSFNNYGLFAAMTQKRPEIIIEGSNNGRDWRPYEFKYKPGDLNKRPGFVAPYQPRLDWQMWFAALGGARENLWFLNFETRLLENSPAVLALLGRNPFPKTPPKYIRALLYEYHFTDMATRRATGRWWRREYKGVYVPAISLPENPNGIAPGRKTAALLNPGGPIRNIGLFD
ncbi:MAG: lipase maturation factor family protein [Limisphaerales bacterium]